MNRKQNLLQEVESLLKNATGDERYIYYALTDLFYKVSDCDETDLFIPKPGAEGIKDEERMINGQCYSLGNNGVYIYF